MPRHHNAEDSFRFTPADACPKKRQREKDRSTLLLLVGRKRKARTLAPVAIRDETRDERNRQGVRFAIILRTVKERAGQGRQEQQQSASKDREEEGANV